MRPAMTSDELMHFGIKGMKWGVRRYQNPDGTRTDAGRKRYGIGNKIFRKTKIKRANKRIAAQQKTDRSRVGEMSDEEIDQRINRLRKEKELINLMNDTKVQDAGRRKISEAIKESGGKLLKDASYKVGMGYVEKYLKNFKGESLQDKTNKLKYDTEKLNYDEKLWDFNKKKNEYARKKRNKKTTATSQGFYYQPKPAQYPALPGPTENTSKKKKKK